MHKKYYYNSKKKIVTCIWCDERDITTETNSPYINDGFFLESNCPKKDESIIDLKSGTSFAKCSDKDTYSNKKGMEVASSKADIAWHKSMVRDYELMEKRLNQAIEECRMRRMKHIQSAQKIQEMIKKKY